MKKMRIMAIALTMVAAFAMTAVAADWNFYGNARISTFLTDVEDGTSEFAEDLQTNSRIGANIKVSETLSARFEYGAADSINLRLLYGTWNFGAGELIVGQAYAPAWLSVSNQVYDSDLGLGGVGENYTDRTPQIQVKFGGFKLAFLETNVKYFDQTTANGTADDEGVANAVLTKDTEVTFPAVQAKYRVDVANFNFTVSGAYQTFECKKEDIDSYMGAARVGATFGPATVKASGFFGQNVGNIAATDVTGTKAGKGYAIIETTDKVTDVDAWGYALVAAYTLNDMIAFEAGFGYAETENDATSKENDVMSYYVQAPLTLAPGVIVIPEIGVIDYKDNGEDNTLYYGAKWQINF